MSRWRRVGRIFQANGQSPWMRSHAANPFVWPLGGSLVRVYFSTRDERNRSSVGSLVIDVEKWDRVLDLDTDPIIGPGEPGLFDDSGTSVGCVVPWVDGTIALFYVGWNLSVTVPWRNSIGLAVSRGDGQRFEKSAKVPLLDRAGEDPFTLSYPFVLPRAGGGWSMWYGSHRSWSVGQVEDMDHVIKRADSFDGRWWERSHDPEIEFGPTDEYAMCRPSVIRSHSGEEMWFACRGRGYRIGYARRRDDGAWERDDSGGGLKPSGEGWDSQEVTYPHVVTISGSRFLFYNGDGYGRTGIGMCIEE